MERTYVGLDTSLQSTGVAVLRPGQAPELTVVASKPKGATLRDRYQRLDNIVQDIVFLIDPTLGRDDPPALDIMVAIEQPAYNQITGSHHDRSGLWWGVVNALMNKADVVEVAPTSLKSFAVGKGSASKAEMMARTAQEFPGVPFKDDNDSDALWLAVMARTHDEGEASSTPLTLYRRKALAGVAWH